MNTPRIIALLEGISQADILKYADSDPVRNYDLQCTDVWDKGQGADIKEMIATATPITMEQFIAANDVATLPVLKEYEIGTRYTVEEALSDFIADDASSGFYSSTLHGREVHFLQTKGFEFIFR